ncbi:MAG: site-specific integrase, partial [Planctomycetota bacterium]
MEDTMIVQEFLNYLKFEKRFSSHTAKCYGADLSQFSQFLSSRQQGDQPAAEIISPITQQQGHATAVATQTKPKLNQLLLAVDSNAVRAYLAFLNENQYSKATIARKLATLRSFYKFLVKRRQLPANPVIAVRTPKQDKRL